MNTQITINVDAEAATAYQTATEEERRKLDLLLNLRLRDATQSKEALTTVMREVSQHAQARGLTPEILQSILDER